MASQKYSEQRRTRSKVTIEVDPFEKLIGVEPQIESAVRDIGRFLGLESELRLGSLMERTR